MKSRYNHEGYIRQYLQEYNQADKARFHMPGHKGGYAFSSEEKSLAHFDITEIAGADNLLSADGIILKAEQNVAKLCGANRTFFITTGATTGLMAMILSLPSQFTLLVSRDCHKSVISGLILSGHPVVFLECVDELDDMIDLIENALKNESIDALLITRPDYWGRCIDIERIAALCQDNNVYLLVDEAHGAHFPYSQGLPSSASSYADMWVQSAHKTLGAWNQCAYLHVNNEMLEEKVLQALKLLHTTSPSYPMLMVLEEAPMQASSGIWSAHVERILHWRKQLPDDIKIALQPLTNQSKKNQDVTRLVFYTRKWGLSGYYVDEFLWENGIAVEMSDEKSVVCITTPFDPMEWYTRLETTLQVMLSRKPSTSEQGFILCLPSTLPVREMSLRDAALSEMEPCDLFQAEGRICAQSAGLYPPGYALLLPGERIDYEWIVYFHNALEKGAHSFGVPFLCVKK